MLSRSTRALALLLLPMGLSCSEGSQGRSHELSGFSVDENDTVAATVNGVPITAARVGRLAAKTGQSPEQVLEKLIDFELLVQEAQKRGLRSHEDVQYAARQRAVQRFLEDEFEASHGPEDMDEQALQKSYRDNQRFFVRPKGIRVRHLLVDAPSKTSTKATRARAHALAERIARQAKGVSTPDDFSAIGKRLESETDLRIRAERIPTPVHKKARLAEPFITATLALTKEGETSEVVDTSFGSHVIYVEEIIPARSWSFEQARDEIIKREHPPWAAREFEAFAQQLAFANKARIVDETGP